MGAAVPPRSVCWHAELIVRGSGYHRAGTGDQDKVGGEWPSRRDGTLAEYSRCEPLPWFPDGSDNAFDTQVGMVRPAEMVPQDPGEVLMENKVARTHLRRADFEQLGLSEGCPRVPVSGNWPGKTASSQRSMPEEDRRPVEGRLGLDPHDWLRLTKESIVHWLTQLRGTELETLE